MQQRRLRLGDILDDYCPRERRITNHAVVAMIEDTVKQTRCTTCDADHEYKGGKVPAARRRKTGTAAAQLVGNPARGAADVHDEMPPTDDSDVQPFHQEDESVAGESSASAEPMTDAAPVAVEETASEQSEDGAEIDKDEWPVHRPLIRATLPRPEGQPPERKGPDFTFRPAGGRFERNGQRRGPRQGRQAQGQPQSGHGPRFGGQRSPGGQQRGSGQGGPQGQRHGNRTGQGSSGNPGQGRGPRQGGGRKRGR